jgi:hypothetical protein
MKRNYQDAVESKKIKFDSENMDLKHRTEDMKAGASFKPTVSRGTKEIMARDDGTRDKHRLHS